MRLFLFFLVLAGGCLVARARRHVERVRAAHASDEEVGALSLRSVV